MKRYITTTELGRDQPKLWDCHFTSVGTETGDTKKRGGKILGVTVVTDGVLGKKECWGMGVALWLGKRG